MRAAVLVSGSKLLRYCEKRQQKLAIKLLSELKAAGLRPDKITYHCVIDASHAANEQVKAEDMYSEMFKLGLTSSHWSTRDKGKLDFHKFTEGMAAAAMRIVLREIVEQKAAARTGNSSNSNSASYVHSIATDLHIITGHGTGDGKQGSVLQPALIRMLKQLNVDCIISARNKGM
eukprot:1980-Heterococcus_DN1.PRE.1